jgi:cellulose synthase/poly-beta-1,6-N-acetylglucosamine synthase-like glycosyltransferase
MQALLKYVVNFRLLYVLFTGLFFYLVSITFDLIFIPMLDMPDQWCEKWVERKIRYKSQKECVEFTNKVEELKYRHNKKMEERHSHKMFGIFLFATLLTFLIMLLSPYSFFDQKITFGNYSGAMAAAIFYGVIIGFLLPTVFQALLPSPAEWLPR